MGESFGTFCEVSSSFDWSADLFVMVKKQLCVGTDLIVLPDSGELEIFPFFWLHSAKQEESSLLFYRLTVLKGRSEKTTEEDLWSEGRGSEYEE